MHTHLNISRCLVFAVSWSVSALASVIFSPNFTPPVHQCSKQRMSEYIQGVKLHTDSESADFMGHINGINVYSFYRTVAI